MEARVFKWSCLGVATIAMGCLVWILLDVRRELEKTNATVNAHLPQIVENVKVATTTLANVSKDIESLRKLVGFADAPTDRSLVAYAASILDFLDAQPTGQIGLTKTLGKGLKDVVPVQDWVRDARKEALWLTFRASSKAELLERLSETKFGSNWMFTAPGIEPMPLGNFLRGNHPDSKGL